MRSAFKHVVDCTRQTGAGLHVEGAARRRCTAPPGCCSRLPCTPCCRAGETGPPRPPRPTLSSASICVHWWQGKQRDSFSLEVAVPRQRILKAQNQQSTEMILAVPRSPAGNHGHAGHYRTITLAVLGSCQHATRLQSGAAQPWLGCCCYASQSCSFDLADLPGTLVTSNHRTLRTQDYKCYGMMRVVPHREWASG